MRQTSITAPIVLVIAMVASCGLGAVAAVHSIETDKIVATAPMVPLDEGRWSLIRTYEDGSQYVTDYNMELGDCYERMTGVQEVLPESSWACERQPTGFIPE